MRPSFLVDDGRLIHQPTPGAAPQWRTLGGEDRAALDGWRATYRRILDGKAADKAPYALGIALFRWLDGPERWLRALIDDGRRPLELEFVTAVMDDPLGQAVLAAPWELLADPDGTFKGFLAADGGLGFLPLRRLRQPRAESPHPPADHALSALFMAAAPAGEHELSFEMEEAAILRAVDRRLTLDLVVEDGGTLGDLVSRLSLEWPVEILHLSCHGLAGEDGHQPLLVLEDEGGAVAVVTPQALLHEIGPDHRPRLIFLSACQTAQDGPGVTAFALPLLQAGAPAVIGWAGSVNDDDAIAFATGLYDRLSRGERVESAAAAARRQMLTQDAEARPHWHLARLFVTGDGGGALCRAGARRRHRRADHAEKTFLAGNKAVPVASRALFVGRRRELQTILRSLRGTDYAGVLIQGGGHLGKSSLAARVVDRMTDHKPAVVFGRCDSDAILDALEQALPDLRDLLGPERDAVRARPDRLEPLLRRVLDGPCAQRDRAGDAWPLLLILDDFERLLDDPPPGGRHRVKAAALPVLTALLRAFAATEGDSRLLITCRFGFELPADLERRLLTVPLGPFGTSTRNKQLWQQLRAAEHCAAGSDADGALLGDCLEAARGNPGLQDVLVALALSAPDAARAATGAMEALLAGTKDAEDPKLAERLKNLALDALFGLLTAEERDFLRAANRFDLPVPLSVLSVLARARGLPDDAPNRLLALAALDHLPDPVDPQVPAAAVGHLLRPRLVPALDDEAFTDAARAVLPTLFRAWGGSKGGRPFEANLLLTGLALAVEDAAVLRDTAPAAVYGLYRRHGYREAYSGGRLAIAVIDRAGLEPPVTLLRWSAESAKIIGDTSLRRTALTRAIELTAKDGSSNPKMAATLRHALAELSVDEGAVDRAQALLDENHVYDEESGDDFGRAVTLSEIARLKADRGDVAEALPLHEEALSVYEGLGATRERAVTLCDIARLKADRGDVAEALRLHEEALSVYEGLGAARERAVTLGDIARLKADRGDVAEALRLHEEALSVLEELGDRDGQANTHWAIGQVLAQANAHEGNAQDATEAVKECWLKSYRINVELGRADGVAVVGMDLAQQFRIAGETDEARILATRSRDLFKKLQWAEEAADAQAFLDSLPPASSDEVAAP